LPSLTWISVSPSSRCHADITDMKYLIPLALIAVLVTGCSTGPETNWYKGNLHTHSFWSDGDDFPEVIATWYKENGYDFLAISDHNTIANGEKWIAISPDSPRLGTFQNYVDQFGEDWVESSALNDTISVRLKTFDEYRSALATDSFLMIQSEEISDGYDGHPIHINATNIQEFIGPAHGNSVLETIQNNVDQVIEQRERLNTPMFPHVNHPNFVWGIKAHELAAVDGERFFEVYNGHPAVHNYGDSLRMGTERMWDVVNAIRLREGRPLMFGLAVDDAHNYQGQSPDKATTGRGWVVVRAESLTPESIVRAMEAGDFYASTGLTLSDVSFDGQILRVAVAPEGDIRYSIEFIGTRRDHDTSSEPVFDENGSQIGYTYSRDLGVVLKSVDGPTAEYALVGDELYVRAVITSDQPMAHPNTEDAHFQKEVERAWTQPVRPLEVR